MKIGIMGKLFPLMFRKTVYGYTAKAVPGLDIWALSGGSFYDLRHPHINEGVRAFRTGSRDVPSGLHHERGRWRIGFCAGIYAGFRRSLLRLRIQKKGLSHEISH